MANTFKFGNGNWAVKDGYALAYNDENNNFKPLPFDFTRASSATTLNRQGLIETVGSGKPRINFTDNTSGHLLLEPQRRNLMTDSELSTTTATTTGDAASSDITLSNGLLGKQITITSSGRAFFYFTATVVSGTQYTVSAFVEDYTGNAASNFIDILSGGGSEDFSSNLIENGRMQGTFTATSTTVGIRVGIGTTSTFSGAYSAKISGIQLEDAGSGNDAIYATSYIPTEGSSVTRSAETGIDCLLPNETIINNSTATVYLEFEALVNDLSNRWISFEELGVPTDNMFEIRLSAGSNLLQIVTRSSGGGQDVVMSETLTDITANNKIAVNYNGLNWKLAVNGTIADTETAARLFNDNIEKIKFSRNTNTNHFYGKVKDLRVYNTALTDTELQNLTS